MRHLNAVAATMLILISSLSTKAGVFSFSKDTKSPADGLTSVKSSAEGKRSWESLQSVMLDAHRNPNNFKLQALQANSVKSIGVLEVTPNSTLAHFAQSDAVGNTVHSDFKIPRLSDAAEVDVIPSRTTFTEASPSSGQKGVVVTRQVGHTINDEIQVEQGLTTQNIDGAGWRVQTMSRQSRNGAIESAFEHSYTKMANKPGARNLLVVTLRPKHSIATEKVLDLAQFKGTVIHWETKHLDKKTELTVYAVEKGEVYSYTVSLDHTKNRADLNNFEAVATIRKNRTPLSEGEIMKQGFRADHVEYVASKNSVDGSGIRGLQVQRAQPAANDRGAN